MRHILALSVCSLLLLETAVIRAEESEDWNNPFWTLLHEPAAIAELDLSATQKRSFHAMRDELDLRFFPLRNKSREDALAGAKKIVAEAGERLKKLLKPEQQHRFVELQLQFLGSQALLTKEITEKLRFSKTQESRIEKINNDTQTAITALHKEVNEGNKDPQLAQKRYDKLLADQQKQLRDVLTSSQRATLTKMLGKPFDSTKLGQPHFRAPDFIDTGEWTNSSPLSLEELRGKVVVVHFYAFGCINCIHNYPWYREWSERFKNKDVVIVGIHTPETNAEKDSSSVRRKAAEAKFDFPVLIDGKKQNWNAWGNSMWPSVYLIDKEGYFRDFWAGELKWKGNDGEKRMREKIEALLAE